MGRPSCPLLLLIAAGCSWLGSRDRVVCDFERAKAPWRSKFDAHEVVELKRDGRTVRALRLSFDLARPPHYDWFRALVHRGIDVRPYRALSFWVSSDGNGARMTTMLVQRTEVDEQHRTGEIMAIARDRAIDLTFTGWRRITIPLEAFDGLEAIADRVEEINFSLAVEPAARRPATVVMDELRLER